MIGPDHYRKAEEHLGWAEESGDDNISAFHISKAQAHATLALAAATAMAAQPGAGHMAQVDFAAWDEVCGVPAD